MDESRLGTILLESRVIGESDLEKCLEIQALTGNTRPLGEVVVEQGLIGRDTLERLLELQAQRTIERARLPTDDSDDRFVRAAVKAGATDLFVSDGRPVRARVGGEWRDLTAEAVRGPEVWDFVRAEMGPDVLEDLAERRFVSCDYVKQGLCRGRITAFRQFDGVAVAVRLHPSATRTTTELGLPPTVVDAVRRGRGLVLVAGDHGSGRTQALAALLNEVAADQSRYVVVIDDNLECEPPPGGGMVVRRRIGDHVRDGREALRIAIREDPDVIVVGDIGSPDVFDTALRAAEGDRLVIGSLHAANVVTAVQRLLNCYPTYDVARVRATLASVLRCILVRQLVPDAVHQGQVAASELLLVDDAVRDVLRAGDLLHLGMLMRMEGSSSGHCLDRSLLDLLGRGQVRFEDVFARAEEKAWVLERTRAGRRPEGK